MKNPLRSLRLVINIAISISMAAPAGAWASSKAEFPEYFELSGEYQKNYFRLLDLNATGSADIGFLESQIPLKRSALEQKLQIQTEKSSALEAIVSELALIPTSIDEKNRLIQSADQAISLAISQAKASKEIPSETEVTPEAIQDKADFYRALANEKQTEIDAQQSKIDEIKADPSYQADLQQQAALQSEKTDAEVSIADMQDENSSLLGQIDQEKSSLVTWRSIQRSTTDSISRLNSSILPDLRSQRASVESDYSRIDSEHRELVFEIQGIEGDLSLLRQEERSQLIVLRRLEDKQDKDKDRRKRINKTLRKIPEHKKKVRNLDQDIQKLDSGIESLNQQIQQKSEQISAAESRKSSLSSEKANLDAQLNELRTKIANAEARLSDLRKKKQQLDKAPEGIRQLRGQISKKEKSKNKVNQEIVELQQTQQELNGKRSATNKRIKELNELIPNKKGNEKAELVKERKNLKKKRERIKKRIGNIAKQIKSKQAEVTKLDQAVAAHRAEIKKLKQAESELPKVKNQISKTKTRIQNMKSREPEINQQLQQNAQKIQQINQQLAELSKDLQPLREKRKEASQRKDRLVTARAELQDIIASESQLKRRKKAIDESMDLREREIRREQNILGRIQDRIDDEQRLLSDLDRELDSLNREKDSVFSELEGLRSQIASTEAELSRLIAQRDEAISGEQASLQFIDSAESQVASNSADIANLQSKLPGLESSLRTLALSISSFEEKNVAPELAILSGLDGELQQLENKESQLLGWKTTIVDSTKLIETSEMEILALNDRQSVLIQQKPTAELAVELANQKVETAQQALTNTQNQVTDLTNEILSAADIVVEHQEQLKQMLADIRQQASDKEGTGIVLGEIEEHSDEEFSKDKNGSSGNWESGIVKNHKLSGQAACVAFTTVQNEQGQDVARLEVYAPELELLNGETVYSEPTIQLVTSSSEIFFLDGGLATERTGLISMNYLAGKNSNSAAQQGAVLEIDQVDRMISRLRKDNKAKAVLSDQLGDVVEYEFSLKGSSKTIQSAMTACGL